jgi:hypothetical protein
MCKVDTISVGGNCSWSNQGIELSLASKKEAFLKALNYKSRQRLLFDSPKQDRKEALHLNLIKIPSHPSRTKPARIQQLCNLI